MEWLYVLGGFIGGLLIGSLLVFLVSRQSEEKRKAAEQALAEYFKNKFASISMETLKKSNENFLTLANEKFKAQTTAHSAELNGKKELIDQQLETMKSELGKVSELVKEFEEKRAEKLGALGGELDKLTRTSTLLQQALADNRSRGQWGERIAEDILKMAGFVEGINYTRQSSIEIGDGKKSRPDFTFNLPNDMCVNMDSKFPLDNYLKFLEVEAETDKSTYRDKFLSDVRDCVKEIGKRGYINPEKTVECVLIFIPNEQIYRFIHEQDSKIIDEALQEKVIICSPMTLYIVVAVIRQAVENFRLNESSKEILNLLNDFKSKWEPYVKKMGEVGKALDKANEAYNELVGKRTRELEKPISRIDDLRHTNGLDKLEPGILGETT